MDRHWLRLVNTGPSNSRRPTSGPVLSPKQIGYVVEQYQAGRSSQSLADELGLSNTTINDYLARHGCKRRSPGRPRTSDQPVVDLRRQGKTMTEISAELGISVSNVSMRLKRAGWLNKQRKPG